MERIRQKMCRQQLLYDNHRQVQKDRVMIQKNLEMVRLDEVFLKL